MDVLSGGEKQRMAVSVYNEELIFWYVFGRVTKHQVLTQHSRVTPQELVAHFIFQHTLTYMYMRFEKNKSTTVFASGSRFQHGYSPGTLYPLEGVRG